jgi:KDO2-lipid IV(A) lauroyltransferase
MKWYKLLKRWFVYKLFKSFQFVVCLLPLRIAVWCGGQFGWFVYYLLFRERKVTLDNLRKSFPDKGWKEIKRIGKEVFVNQGKNFCEVLFFFKFTKNDIVNLVKAEGLEHIDRALKEGKQVIYFTGHLGNWELMAAYLSSRGYPLNVIARKVYDERFNKILLDLRGTKGTKTILRDESPKKILKALKRKEIIGMLIDQDTSRVQSVFVDFFGRPAYTPIGTAMFACRRNVVVIPGFIVRRGKRHYLKIEQPVELIKKEKKEEEIRENTQKLTKIIESWVRLYPQQWVWMHKRWKRKPGFNNLEKRNIH